MEELQVSVNGELQQKLPGTFPKLCVWHLPGVGRCCHQNLVLLVLIDRTLAVMSHPPDLWRMRRSVLAPVPCRFFVARPVCRIAAQKLSINVPQCPSTNTNGPQHCHPHLEVILSPRIVSSSLHGPCLHIPNGRIWLCFSQYCRSMLMDGTWLIQFAMNEGIVRPLSFDVVSHAVSTCPSQVGLLGLIDDEAWNSFNHPDH